MQSFFRYFTTQSPWGPFIGGCMAFLAFFVAWLIFMPIVLKVVFWWWGLWLRIP